MTFSKKSPTFTDYFEERDGKIYIEGYEVYSVFRLSDLNVDLNYGIAGYGYRYRVFFPTYEEIEELINTAKYCPDNYFTIKSLIWKCRFLVPTYGYHFFLVPGDNNSRDILSLVGEFIRLIFSGDLSPEFKLSLFNNLNTSQPYISKLVLENIPPNWATFERMKLLLDSGIIIDTSSNYPDFIDYYLHREIKDFLDNSVEFAIYVFKSKFHISNVSTRITPLLCKNLHLILDIPNIENYLENIIFTVDYSIFNINKENANYYIKLRQFLYDYKLKNQKNTVNWNLKHTFTKEDNLRCSKYYNDLLGFVVLEFDMYGPFQKGDFFGVFRNLPQQLLRKIFYMIFLSTSFDTISQKALPHIFRRNFPSQLLE